MTLKIGDFHARQPEYRSMFQRQDGIGEVEVHPVAKSALVLLFRLQIPENLDARSVGLLVNFPQTEADPDSQQLILEIDLEQAGVLHLALGSLLELIETDPSLSEP